MDMCSGGQSPLCIVLSRFRDIFLDLKSLQLRVFFDVWLEHRIFGWDIAFLPSIHCILTMYKCTDLTCSTNGTMNNFLYVILYTICLHLTAVFVIVVININVLMMQPHLCSMQMSNNILL